MSLNKSAVHVLLAEDDPDDRLLIRRAFHAVAPTSTITMVPDGEEVLEYLNRRGRYEDPAESPWPSLILLDLNMPRKDGREALREIKSNPDFRRIPVVVLTTSRAEEDIFRSYDLGVNSFVSKPMSFGGLVAVLKELGHYWVEIVELPNAIDS